MLFRGVLGAGLIWVSFAEAAPVVNEFVARPADEEGEWIEVLNPEDAPVSLVGWSLRDGTGNRRAIIAPATVPARGFLILAARPESLSTHYGLPPEIPVVRPQGWPVLNDRDASPGAPADVIVLSDARGVAVDSLAYYEAWLPPDAGRSLERAGAGASATSPASWGWSGDPSGATPGRTNSIAGGNPPPLEGSWEGPGHVEPGRVPAVFVYRWPESGTLTIALLDLDGRVVHLLQEPQAVGAAGRWVWGAGLPAARRPGEFFLCMRWEGEVGRLLRVCRRVWVTP